MADIDDEFPPVTACVRNAVARELREQVMLRGDSIELADVAEVAYAVAVQLGREFTLEQHRDEPADDDSLGPDGATFNASALPPAPSDRYPIFDRSWHGRW